MQLSIIICTKNSAERLAKTLDSILIQNVNDYEIIVIDGASSDGTVDIIKEYEEKSKGKLKWISEKDTGIYSAINKGVRMAKGKYLNIIGAGDWLEEDALDNAYKCIENNPTADAVHGKLRVWDKGCTNSYLWQTKQADLLTEPMQHPALYYRKSLHDRFGLYDESYKIVADYLFCLKAFYIGDAVAVPFKTVVDNYIVDGISSNKDTCGEETQRARRALKLTLLDRKRSFLNRLSNSRLRQPIRKIWYGLQGKKLK